MIRIFAPAIALTTILGAILTLTTPALADYATPGLGQTYSFDDLVTISAGAVTGSPNAYVVHERITISATDRLEIGSDSHITFMGANGSIGIVVNGSLEALGSPDHEIIFTGDAAFPGCWLGLDYEDQSPGSTFHIAHAEIAYADVAVDTWGADITLEFCDIHDCLDKAIDFSYANGLVQDCHIHHNRARTLTMTLNSSPTIERCVLEHNNMDNASPFPYINVGLQGTNSPFIHQCTITGNGNQMSGGMAFWALGEAHVANNSISGCGYGILCYSTGANPRIENNQIFDNTIHPDTVNWGFGVACNGDNAPTLVGNNIHGHWYGVAAINGGRPNLGNVDNLDPTDDGGNDLANNGIGGALYGFYNNTPIEQWAQNNHWGDDIYPEDAVYHQVDDPSLGFVHWDPPISTSSVTDTPEALVLQNMQAYPNPFNPLVQIKLEMAQAAPTEVIVMDAAGRVVRRLHSGTLPAGETILRWDGTDDTGRPQASSVYWIKGRSDNQVTSIKAVLIR